jgi:hypothetical protein
LLASKSKSRGCGTAVAASVRWLDVMIVGVGVEVEVGMEIEVGMEVELMEVEVCMLAGVEVLAEVELFAGAVTV